MSVDLAKSNFFWGDVFSAQWIVDSVQRQQLQDQSNYLAFINNENNIKRLEFDCGKVKYTLREGIKIFELAIANPTSNSGATFWLKVERENHIVRRTGDSMRAFWKLHRTKGIEKYLEEASTNPEIRYCHTLKHLPCIVVHHANYASQSEARMFDLAGRGKVVHYTLAPEK